MKSKRPCRPCRSMLPANFGGGFRSAETTMTDQPANIIPIGKYKGRTVEEILLEDPSYLEWLGGQDWFRTKHVNVYQVIINRGGEPQDTPEHNALQVKFLDEDFRERFIRWLIPELPKD